MSVRKKFTNDETELFNALNRLDFDEDIPEDILIAIKNAEDSIEKRDNSSDIPSGQPYRLSDSDDFPYGTYIQNRSGRVISKHFRISDEYQIKQESFLDKIESMGFRKIFVREYLLIT